MSATDKATGTITGSQPSIQVVSAATIVAAAASSLTAKGFLSPTRPGTGHQFTVTATG